MNGQLCRATYSKSFFELTHFCFFVAGSTMPDRLFAMGLQSFDAYGRPQHRRTWRYHVPVAICKCHLCSHIRLAFSLETQGFRVPSVPNIGHKCEKWDEVRHNSHIATFHISFHRFPFSVHLQPPRQTLEVASKCKHHFSFSRFSAVWHLKSTTPPRDSWEAYHRCLNMGKDVLLVVRLPASPHTHTE